MLLINPLAFVAFVAAGPRPRLNHLYSPYHLYSLYEGLERLQASRLWSTSKAFKITSNDNLKVHKESALAPQPVLQSVRSLVRLPICSWLSVVSFNVS